MIYLNLGGLSRGSNSIWLSFTSTPWPNCCAGHQRKTLYSLTPSPLHCVLYPTLLYSKVCNALYFTFVHFTGHDFTFSYVCTLLQCTLYTSLKCVQYCTLLSHIYCLLFCIVHFPYFVHCTVPYSLISIVLYCSVHFLKVCSALYFTLPHSVYFTELYSPPLHYSHLLLQPTLFSAKLAIFLILLSWMRRLQLISGRFNL